MPTYVYRRQDGTTFEVFQRISDDPLEVDPDTGEPVSRVIGGGAGLIFKGTGFYETDYVRKSGGPESKSEGAESKADSKSESKTESKTSNGGAGTSTEASKKTSSSDD
jgi:predicted nucleic acid-binding Zn ribbon protein